MATCCVADSAETPGQKFAEMTIGERAGAPGWAEERRAVVKAGAERYLHAVAAAAGVPVDDNAAWKQWSREVAAIRCESARAAFASLCERATGLTAVPFRVSMANDIGEGNAVCFPGKPEFRLRTEQLPQWGALREYVPGETEWDAARYLALAYVALWRYQLVDAFDCWPWPLPWHLPEDTADVLTAEHPPTPEEAATDIRWVLAKAGAHGRLLVSRQLPPGLCESFSHVVPSECVQLHLDGTVSALPAPSLVGQRIVSTSIKPIPGETTYVYQADWVVPMRPRWPECTPKPPDVAFPPYPTVAPEPQEVADARARVTWLRSGDFLIPEVEKLGTDFMWLLGIVRMTTMSESDVIIEWANDEGEVVAWIKGCARYKPMGRWELRPWMFHSTALCPDGTCISRFDRATFSMMARALGAPSIENLLEGLGVVRQDAARYGHEMDGLWLPAPAAPGVIRLRNLRPCSEWAYRTHRLHDETPPAELAAQLANDTWVFPKTRPWSFMGPEMHSLSADRKEMEVLVAPGTSQMPFPCFFQDDWNNVALPIQCTSSVRDDYVTLRAPEGYVFDF